MNRLVGLCLVGASVAVFACSTSRFVPKIDTFGSTVVGIADRDRRTPAGASLATRAAAARLEDFAAAQVRFTAPGFGEGELSEADIAAIGACDYVRRDVNARPPTFREACAIVPRDPQGRVVASHFDDFAVQEAADRVVPVQAHNRPLLREFLGFGIRDDLKGYAEQLSLLATADTPEKIGAASGDAFGALLGLRDAVGAAASETGTAPPATPRVTAAKTLVPLLSREIAETLRYRRLKAIVRAADPVVQRAAVQLSILAYEAEAGELERIAAAFQAERMPDDWGSLRNLRATEAAWERLARADETAAFRAYVGIGEAHHAILESLSAPSSFERLDEANRRIFQLADALKAFAES